MELSVGEEKAQRVFDQFMDHHTSKATRSADWRAEFRLWVRREADFMERGKANA
ncbi:MAG: hypothetical protein QNJ03_00110 [Dinoroseobacter sp.]|nr:hypothetical protein [Dinoroseobacter sp.]